MKLYKFLICFRCSGRLFHRSVDLMTKDFSSRVIRHLVSFRASLLLEWSEMAQCFLKLHGLRKTVGILQKWEISPIFDRKRKWDRKEITIILCGRSFQTMFFYQKLYEDIHFAWPGSCSSRWKRCLPEQNRLQHCLCTNISPHWIQYVSLFFWRQLVYMRNKLL